MNPLQRIKAIIQHPHKQIWAIAGPAILANSSAPLVGLVDTWAIGHLPGAVHLAAVGLGSVIFSYLLWAFGFLRMGTTGLIAQAKGREDVPDQVVTVIRSSGLAVFFGLLLFVFQEGAAGLVAESDGAAGQRGGDYLRVFPHSHLGGAVYPAGLRHYRGAVRAGAGAHHPVAATVSEHHQRRSERDLRGGPGPGRAGRGAGHGDRAGADRGDQRLDDGADFWQGAACWPHCAMAATWVLSGFRKLVLVNGFIFIRTIFLMTALALIMRVAARMGTVEMAASHVLNQYMLLIALGLDGFAHASEALAGAAWGRSDRAQFRRWVYLTGYWSLVASLAYSLLFWLVGNDITALLTDIESVRVVAAALLPLVIALPLVSVWCFLFDGVYIGATAAASMMVTMGIAFVIYLFLLEPMTEQWGLHGLWGAVLVFMAVRGLGQAIWYPRLERRLS